MIDFSFACAKKNVTKEDTPLPPGTPYNYISEVAHGHSFAIFRKLLKLVRRLRQDGLRQSELNSRKITHLIDAQWGI